MAKIKALIFDLWGTTLETGVMPPPLRQSKKILGLFNMDYPQFVVRFEKAFMTTKYDDVKEGLDRVFKEFDVSPDEYNRVERLIGLWNKAKIQSELYDETIEVLNNLKKDYKIILLSNLPCVEEDLLDRFKFKELFDHIFTSYNVGMIKSDPKTYEHVLKQSGFKAEQVIMVGDSMESDINASAKAGIKGILVDRKERRDYKHKVKSLKELKNIIREVEKDE